MTCVRPSPTARRFFCLFYQWIAPSRNFANFESTRNYRGSQIAVRLPQPWYNGNPALLRRTRTKIYQGSKHGAQYRSLSTTSHLRTAEPAPAKHSGGLDSVEDMSPLSHNVRLTMRHVPHSVVVVTSSLLATKLDHQQRSPYRGMTVSSFTTVALSPTPTVCFNVRAPSSTLTAIRESGRFLVHVLDASPLGAKVADAFTRGLGAAAFDNQAFGVSEGGGGMPLLVSPGVRRVLHCRAFGEGVTVGDHVIVLGEVADIQGEVQGSECEKGYGLVYVDRAYRCVGKDIPILGDQGR
ncbi:hypothetical protein GP486_003151 [Trichoglossum hirsutum]|uniref:Flavin reductase like domain-containing protein n=1 Tax=Trichoglossum hirsutum TaxID=265104 RepID=A0A9P8RR22_9PEZI|nr:hypothetical protein GP486_003151 [Trichoglossum hirsutum]